MAPREILTDILPQDILNLFLCISPLHDQSLGTIDRPLSTQLGIQKLNDVFGLTMHSSTDIGEIGKDGLFGPFSSDLRRDHGVFPFLAGEFGVMSVKEGEEAG